MAGPTGHTVCQARTRSVELMSSVERRLELDHFARDERALVGACDSVVHTTGIVAGLRAAESLQLLACQANGAFDTVDVLAELLDQRDDQLAAIAGVHALSGVPGSLATAVLNEALDDDRWFVTEHAAWSFSARSPHRGAMDRLASMVAEGGFRGMVAQRTLAGWAHGDRNGVLPALSRALEHADGAGRVALIDTVGAVPGTDAIALLETVASDGDDVDAQLCAIAALGWRPSDPDPLARLALDDTDVGEIAFLALIDKTLSTRTTDVTRPSGSGAGHRIAQVVIHAEFDERLIRSGAGDNGGLSTLVSQLSTAFADRNDVTQITTITRGSTGDAITDAFFGCDDKQRLASVPFGGRATIDRRSSWEHRLAVERGMRRVFLAGARPDVVHLRMADVGTLAAGRVARQLGIPVVFTAAPDPHVVLGQLDTAKVSRRNFGDHDELEHYWFRARMVERMTNQAAQVVLLPRSDGGELRRAFGDRAAGALQRAITIAEGVDPEPIRRARTVVSALDDQTGWPLPIEPLRRALQDLAPERWGLPLVVSVGRLHPGKGMDRVATAWAGDGTLRRTTNLLIIGGDHERPTVDELDVLAELDEILGDADERQRTGVVLLGHQPNEVVAYVLAAATIGLPGLVAPGGLYVCGAAKEEFGLAIVEALGAGLTVVAPDVGGPATYVTDGDTGVLTDTRSVSGLRTAMGRARGLVDRPGRIGRARDLVLSRLTIDAMAAALIDAYSAARVDVA